MSYQSYPSPTRVEIHADGNRINTSIRFDSHCCPPKISDLIYKMGWCDGTIDPDTGEQLFKMDPMKKSDSMWEEQQIQMRWYEVLAYEFANFISLGNDTA